MHNFKQGDWFVGSLTNEPTVVKDNEHAQFLNTVYNGLPIKLWQPKEGEYIWDKDYGLSIVISNDKNGIYCEHLFHTSNINTKFTTSLKECQPFIGVLPKF